MYGNNRNPNQYIHCDCSGPIERCSCENTPVHKHRCSSHCSCKKPEPCNPCKPHHVTIRCEPKCDNEYYDSVSICRDNVACLVSKPYSSKAKYIQRFHLDAEVPGCECVKPKPDCHERPKRECHERPKRECHERPKRVCHESPRHDCHDCHERPRHDCHDCHDSHSHHEIPRPSCGCGSH